MILYHYEKGDRPPQVGGFWFDYGGIPRTDTPSFMYPMTYIQGWNKDYICCCNTLQDVLTYFPLEIHRKLNGVFNVYNYEGPIIVQRDQIMEYMTANCKLMQLIETLSYDQARRRVE